MCMTKPYMFLTCLIPGPTNPTKKIDVYLQPLIDDLQLLRNEGVFTYDIFGKENFVMQACLMWTINDFPAYRMLSGWRTKGKLACPHCMEDTKAFTLRHGGKASWFDCRDSFQQIIFSGRVRGDFLKTKLKWMSHLTSWMEANYGGFLVIFQK